MRTALSLARRAQGRTHPNPCVGAVVFRGDHVLGRGYTRPPGGPHAEIVAIRNAVRRVGASRVRGASLAVTLEPCFHTGRTGPCTDAILAAELRRVFVGHTDPHREVAGRGIRKLRRRGVSVTVGVLEAECRALHRGFLTLCERGRPFVNLKLASTLDGRIATASGESRWITGPESRAAVHRMRARSDAILVGSGTVLADDPTLTARRGDRVLHRPTRVVVDSRLRVPPTARVFDDDAADRWVLTRRDGSPRRRRALEARGVRLLDVPGRGRYLDLDRALEMLGSSGLTEVLVEGGGELAAALLRRGLVDEVNWFAAPLLLGSDALPALGPLEVGHLAEAWRLGDVRRRRSGADLHLCATLSRTTRKRGGARRR